MRKKFLGIILVIIVIFSVSCSKDIKKVDVETKKIDDYSGAELTFKDDSDNPISDVTFEILKNGKIISIMQTDSRGKSLIKLPAGEYIYIIKSVPDGFMLDENEYKLTVGDGITSISRVLAPVQSGISLKVIDEFGNKIPDVEFIIFKDGQVIQTLITESNGKAVANLPSGNYIYIMKSVPKGFILNETEHQFNIDRGMTNISFVLNSIY